MKNLFFILISFALSMSLVSMEQLKRADSIDNNPMIQYVIDENGLNNLDLVEIDVKNLYLGEINGYKVYVDQESDNYGFRIQLNNNPQLSKKQFLNLISTHLYEQIFCNYDEKNPALKHFYDFIHSEENNNEQILIPASYLEQDTFIIYQNRNFLKSEILSNALYVYKAVNSPLKNNETGYIPEYYIYERDLSFEISSIEAIDEDVTFAIQQHVAVEYKKYMAQKIQQPNMPKNYFFEKITKALEKLNGSNDYLRSAIYLKQSEDKKLINIEKSMFLAFLLNEQN